MNTIHESYRTFKQSVRESQLDESFMKCEIAACFSGPAVVIESIVRAAEEKTGIPMDWGYVGGRGYVYVKGDVTKARSALFMALPSNDLTQADI